MQIVLDTRGMQMSVRNNCFLFETEADSRIVHPSRIGSILITAACRISSPALILAAVRFRRTATGTHVVAPFYQHLEASARPVPVCDNTTIGRLGQYDYTLKN